MSTAADHESVIALMHAANWNAARAELERTLAGDAEDVRAWRLLGTVNLLDGHPQQALAALERALPLAPDNTSTLLNLGSVYLELVRLDDAVRCFERVVELQPTSADGHFNLGLAAQKQQREAQAEQHYLRALAIDPGASDAAVNLATSYFRQARHEQCVEQATRILDTDATHISARVLLLRSLLAVGDLAAADRVLTQTPQACFAHAALRSAIGTLHSMNGRLAQAADAWRAAIKLGDARNQTVLDLAGCLLESGEPQAAAEELQRLIARDADNAEHHALLGLALNDAGQPQAALNAYEKALQLSPKSVHLLTAKANLLFMLGRSEAAEQTVDTAIASAPNVVSPHLLRVEQLIARGEPAAALEACERWLERAGAECNMLAAKAFLLHALGRDAESQQLLDYDRLIATTIIDPPPGYTDTEAFNNALVEHLLAHPSLSVANAASKATQHGRQSGNLLFGERGPFDAFEQVLWRGARDYVARRKRDVTHPFLGNPPTLDVVYAWAVVLERAGYQTPHIHPTAWLSGVYYPKVPAVISTGNGQENSGQENPGQEDPRQQGWIEFGAPPPELAIEPRAPTRRIKPREGLLVLFPSYFYHRTVPWHSDEQRISIAFDFSSRTRR